MDASSNTDTYRSAASSAWVSNQSMGVIFWMVVDMVASLRTRARRAAVELASAGVALGIRRCPGVFHGVCRDMRGAARETALDQDSAASSSGARARPAPAAATISARASALNSSSTGTWTASPRRGPGRSTRP